MRQLRERGGRGRGERRSDNKECSKIVLSRLAVLVCMGVGKPWEEVGAFLLCDHLLCGGRRWVTAALSCSSRRGSHCSFTSELFRLLSLIKFSVIGFD